MDFLFPDVGEGLTEGTLLKWLVAVGDVVTLDQPIAQVETDKAVVDIPSPTAGKITELIGTEGELLTVGEVMARFDTDAKPSANAPEHAHVQANPLPQKEASKVVPKSEPQDQPVQPAPTHESHEDILAMPNVRKFAREHSLDLTHVSPSGAHGQITLSDIDGAPKVEAQPQQASAPAKSCEAKSCETKTEDASVHPFIPINKNTPTARVLATPSIRRMAREKGIDITTITGSGTNGRILAEDLDKQSEKVTEQVGEKVASAPVSLGKQQVPKPAPQPSPKTAQVLGGDSTRVPLSKTRQVIAKRMVESLQHTASVTTSDEVDVTDIFALYEEEKTKLKEQDIKLSFLSFITKVVTLALKKHPLFNATLDEATNELIMHNNVHMGIAVATPKGLLVPVIQKADDLSIADIAQSISSLAKKARDGQLTVPEMSGSTFTISNMGSIGGSIFTPIINYPEVAILGVGKMAEKPVVLNGEIVIRKMLWLSLTFDHRVGDGADAAFFMNVIKEYLEDEKKLLVNMS